MEISNVSVRLTAVPDELHTTPGGKQVVSFGAAYNSGPRQSRRDSGLTWADVGRHGPCGGLRFSTPSTASEKARARDLIFPVRLGHRAGDR